MDDQVVIDFDKVHGYGEKNGKVTLTRGDHPRFSAVRVVANGVQ